MIFLWLWGLWLLLLVPVLIIAYVLIQRQRRKYALKYSNLSLVKEALGNSPGRRRHIPPVLFLIGLTVMIVAIARPAGSVTLPSQRGTVILTIDVSGSMRADDFKPSRLEAAKAAARAFLSKQPENVRIGVVSFSESAAVVQAPTTNREELTAAINRLVYQRRTAIGSGINTSLSVIFEEPKIKPTLGLRDPILPTEPATSPPPLPRGTYAPAVIVLLSDGQSNTGPAPLEASAKAADRGVRIFTVGIGSPEGTVLKFEGYSVRVRLDETTLKNIADKTDGEYFKAEDEADLLQIYQKLSTEIVFKEEKTELTAWFTGASAFFLLFSVALSLFWFQRLP